MNNITISLPKLVSCNSISSCSKVRYKRGTSNEGYIVEMLDKYNMKSWFLTDERQDTFDPLFQMFITTELFIIEDGNKFLSNINKDNFYFSFLDGELKSYYLIELPIKTKAHNNLIFMDIISGNTYSYDNLNRCIYSITKDMTLLLTKIKDSGHSSDILSNGYFKKVAPLLLPQYFSYFIQGAHLNTVDEGCNILC